MVRSSVLVPVTAVALLAAVPVGAQLATPSPGGVTWGHFDHVGFEIDDLEAFTKTLAARGVAFDVEYRTIGEGLALAFFTNPSGTYREFTEGLDSIARMGSGR